MMDGSSAPQARFSTTECVDSADALQRFQAIVAEADEGVLILEDSGIVTYANEAAIFLLGQGRTEMKGELFGLPLSPGDHTVSVNVIARDKSLRLVEMRIEPLPEAFDGARVLRVRDVTGYHKSVSQARQEVRQRDEFLAMLSHELRNPLAAIRSAASLLALEGLPAAGRIDANSVIDRQFQHLKRILDDLLDVTRILRGKLALTQSRVDLNQVLLDAVAGVNPQMTRNRQSLKLDLPAQRVWVWGDETRLEQIAVNLLNNAAKFSPPQGEIRMSVEVVDSTVQITVRDNGPGIDAELLPRIFEAFVQGSQPLDRTDGGLGIGLMLVRQFTQLHCGTVHAGNHPDGGAFFTVTLPVLDRDPICIEPAEALRTNGPLRVLLVEDCDDVRRMLKWLLQRDGFEVLEASTGTDGLASLLAEPLDVALVDIGLPGINGYEVARRLHRGRSGPLPKMIAVTGYGRPEDVAEARQAGFDDHLVKPVQVQELRSLLERVCRDIGVSPAVKEHFRSPLAK